MPFSTKRIFYKEHVFNINQNVYEPAEDTFLFAQNLMVRHGAKVADIGTGCGILGILAAERAIEVQAIDINPWAIQCAKKNARLACVDEKILLIQGDLFGPLRPEERFDLILFNAPYLPSEKDEGKLWIEQAWVGGPTGRKIIDAFIFEAPKHLNSNGEILLMQSTLSKVEETIERLKEKGLNTSIIAKQDLQLFETIMLIRAKSNKHYPA